MANKQLGLFGELETDQGAYGLSSPSPPVPSAPAEPEPERDHAVSAYDTAQKLADPYPKPTDLRETIREAVAAVVEEATRDCGEGRCAIDCHWPDCTEDVPGRMWACQKHWGVLPIPIRERLLRTFDLGAENSGTATAEYLLAVKAAYRWIELNAGDLREEGVI